MSLNLFDIPDIDYRYEAKRWIPFKPANTGTRPILFTVPAGDDYYDLNETKLEIKVRMNTTGTGGLSSGEGAASDANNTKYVYCVNNFGHSLFNQMNVSFNGVLMTEQSNAYHQKAYLETLQSLVSLCKSLNKDIFGKIALTIETFHPSPCNLNCGLTLK